MTTSKRDKAYAARLKKLDQSGRLTDKDIANAKKRSPAPKRKKKK
jgi:hypothetical protein